MSMSNVAETALLNLYFNNTDAANIGDATGLRGSSTAGNFYVSLHTGDPGEAGTQLTSESGYTGYDRVAIPRTAGGFTITGNQVANAALVQFPLCSGGSSTVTHWAFGTAASGAGSIVLKGSLSSSLNVANGIQPQFNAGALTPTVD